MNTKISIEFRHLTCFIIFITYEFKGREGILEGLDKEKGKYRYN